MSSLTPLGSKRSLFIELSHCSLLCLSQPEQAALIPHFIFKVNWFYLSIKPLDCCCCCPLLRHWCSVRERTPLHATCKPISSARVGPRQKMIGLLLKSILSRVTSPQRHHTFLQRNTRDKHRRQASSGPGTLLIWFCYFFCKRSPPVARGAMSSGLDRPREISEGKLVQNQRVEQTRRPKFSLSQNKQSQQFLERKKKKPSITKFPKIVSLFFFFSSLCSTII